MLKTINPPALAAPFARYSHAVEAAAGLRWVFCSGQLGMDAAGHVPPGGGLAHASKRHAALPRWREYVLLLFRAELRKILVTCTKQSIPLR